MKLFLQKIWDVDRARLTAEIIDDILSTLSVKLDPETSISKVMDLIYSLGLDDEGGIFANGNYIKKDNVFIIR